MPAADVEHIVRDLFRGSSYEHLSQGPGGSTVVAVTDKNKQPQAIIKVASDGSDTNCTSRGGLAISEEAALLRLRGVPGVVQVKHVVDMMNPDRSAVVLPYLQKVDYNPVLESRQACFDFVSSLVHTVAQCHSRGVAHGDIKPDNIMQGPDGRPTLIDFDLALKPHDEKADEFFIGTPGFIFRDSPYHTGADMDSVTLGNYIGWLLFEDEGFGTYVDYDWEHHRDAQACAEEIAYHRAPPAEDAWKCVFMRLAVALMSCSASLMSTWYRWEHTEYHQWLRMASLEVSPLLVVNVMPGADADADADGSKPSTAPSATADVTLGGTNVAQPCSDAPVCDDDDMKDDNSADAIDEAVALSLHTAEPGSVTPP